MLIGGFQKLSLVDYPGRLSAIVFTMGCNLRCPFCHNKDLVDCTAQRIPEDYVLSHLSERNGKLDAVTITGGEPTLQTDLPEFAKKLKDIGFSVKLDTNGSRPEILDLLLSENLLDYIAMDIKAPLDFESYNRLCGGVLTEETFGKIRKSVATIKESGIEHEFRTTLIAEVHTAQDIKSMLKETLPSKHFFQKFEAGNTMNPNWGKYNPFSEAELKSILKKLESKNVVFRF
jgi:pyruvate formate lyase activating enzyme